MTLPAWASVIIALGAAAIVAFSAEQIYNKFTRTPFKPAGKHCFITGGSTGLGKALAIDLVKQGANVTIVARRESELRKAVEEIEASKQSQQQRVIFISADVTSKDDVIRAFDEAKVKMGCDPEFVCCCAGASYPKFFLDHTLDEFDQLMRLNYLGQAYVAHQAATRMRDGEIKNGKIVFVSSMLGLLSFVGFATYSPTKYAVRGLSDTLRNELKRYNIDVHIFFPGNIDSPGFEVENMTKPQVTKEIEGASIPLSPADCSKALMHGLKSGHYMITTEFLGELIRTSTRGLVPTNNLFVDWFLAIISQPIGSCYAMYIDYLVKSQKDA